MQVYISVHTCIFKGPRPPAAGPSPSHLGTSLIGVCTAGLRLLAGDCCLVNVGSSFARGRLDHEPQEVLGRAMGGLWDDPGRARARAGAKVGYWAGHGPFGFTFSNEFGGLVNLDLRFPLLLCLRTFSLGACAMKPPKAQGAIWAQGGIC